MFLTSGKNMFCFRAEKFVFETYTSGAAKQGNICLRNYNVSVTIFPSLTKPDILSFLVYYIILQGHLFIFCFFELKTQLLLMSDGPCHGCRQVPSLKLFSALTD